MARTVDDPPRGDPVGEAPVKLKCYGCGSVFLGKAPIRCPACDNLIEQWMRVERPGPVRSGDVF